jgi:hypothetical protein
MALIKKIFKLKKSEAISIPGQCLLIYLAEAFSQYNDASQT